MTDTFRSVLPDLIAAFASSDWDRESISAAMKSIAAKHGLKPGQVMMGVRTLVTGVPQTPPIDAVLQLIGRDAVRARIKAGLGL